MPRTVGLANIMAMGLPKKEFTGKVLGNEPHK
jgi:hypothetical protein